jgi:nicotinate dehydrogenase subunit A
MAKISLNVDGQSHSIDADGDMPLLYALRDDLGLRNPKFGCGLAQCGACTVLVDGEPVRSCITPVDSLGASKITTLAGLPGLAGLGGGKAHKIQEAFIAEEVPQCGYCLNGWLMTAATTARKPFSWTICTPGISFTEASSKDTGCEPATGGRITRPSSKRRRSRAMPRSEMR